MYIPILSFLFSRVLEHSATNKEKEQFIFCVDQIIDDSWEKWQKRKENRTEEEERDLFIKRMKKQGFLGKTYEEALLFLDKEFPCNVRRLNDEIRRKKRLTI